MMSSETTIQKTRRDGADVTLRGSLLQSQSAQSMHSEVTTSVVKGSPTSLAVSRNRNGVVFGADENECSAEDMCENGQCVNLDGSFKCLCETGYTLSPSGKQCHGQSMRSLPSGQGRRHGAHWGEHPILPQVVPGIGTNPVSFYGEEKAGRSVTFGA